MSDGYNADYTCFLAQKIFHARCNTEIIHRETEILSNLMVAIKKLLLNVQIEVDVPVDIVQDKMRIKAVEDGLARSVSKGLYDQGVSFRIVKIGSKIV